MSKLTYRRLAHYSTLLPSFSSNRGRKTEQICLRPTKHAQKIKWCTTHGNISSLLPFSSYKKRSLNLGNDPCSPLIPHSELCRNKLASEFTKMVLLGAFVGSSWQELIKNLYLPLEKAESSTPWPPLALNMVSNLAYTPSCSAHKLSCMHLGLLMKQAMINPLGENTKMFET